MSVRVHGLLELLGCSTAIALTSAALAAQPLPAGDTSGLEAQFHGCDATVECRFRIDLGEPLGEAVYRVVPDGVVRPLDDVILARLVRDRLNALLASMIHQHKRIELYALRARGDETYAATVTVDGADVAADPVLEELKERSR